MPLPSDTQDIQLLEDSNSDKHNFLLADNQNMMFESITLFPESTATEENEAFPGAHQLSVTFKTVDAAAELYLIDRTYALIAKSIGELHTKVVPGIYKIRQRIGYLESVETVEISENKPLTVNLSPLVFSSPIPLPNTMFGSQADFDINLVNDKRYNFRFVIWTPRSMISDSVSKISEVLAQLRLESFDGTIQHTFEHTIVLNEGDTHGILGLSLEDGSYVLVQSDINGRQKCLPIWICSGLVTAIYLLALFENGNAISVSLEHAAIAMLRAEDFGLSGLKSLSQLEAARKTLSLGRKMYGWTYLDPSDEPSATMNPLLTLIDAQLLACAESPSDARVTHAIATAANLISTEFPDVIALNSLVSSREVTDEIDTVWSSLLSTIKGPPLLRCSWTQLLNTTGGDMAMAKLMPSSLQIEGTCAWFMWSEEVGARLRVQKILQTDSFSITENIPAPPLTAAKAYAKISNLNVLASKGLPVLLPLTDIFSSLFLRFNKPNDLTSPRLETVITFENLVQMLSALLENDSLKKSLAKAYQAISQQNFQFDNAPLQRLFISLEVLMDETLVRAIGAEKLVRQVLISSGLPQTNLIELVKTLIDRLLAQLSPSDRLLVLKTLTGVVAIAEKWLSSLPAESADKDK